jgi:hypothetical protein
MSFTQAQHTYIYTTVCHVQHAAAAATAMLQLQLMPAAVVQAACYGLLQSLASPSESALQAPSGEADTVGAVAGPTPVVPEECNPNSSSSSSSSTNTSTTTSSSSSSVQAVSAGEGLAPSPALLLTATEADVLRWAANSTTNSPPSHATRQQYKQATAVEALVSRGSSRACVYAVPLKHLTPVNQVLHWQHHPDGNHQGKRCAPSMCCPDPVFGSKHRGFRPY